MGYIFYLRSSYRLLPCPSGLRSRYE